LPQLPIQYFSSRATFGDFISIYQPEVDSILPYFVQAESFHCNFFLPFIDPLGL